MKTKNWPLLFSFVFCLIFCSCHSSQENPNKNLTFESVSEMTDTSLAVRASKIRDNIDNIRKSFHDTTFVDRQSAAYYAGYNSFLWIQLDGKRVDDRADSLLVRLNEAEKHAISPDLFYTKKIEKDLEKVRTLKLSSNEDINDVMARLEFYLTRAYTRYCCGMRFGFVDPFKLYNRSEQDAEGNYKYLFDIDVESANKDYIAESRNKLHEHEIVEFLNDALPKNSLYWALHKEYTSNIGNKKLIANLERARWRTKQKEEERMITVNIPAFQLRATDPERDSTLTMKICCGQRDHKTPLVMSKITRLELNPYWLVPFNIIKNEIAPKHAFDEDYFERNNMKIIEKGTGEELDVSEASQEALLSGKYYVRQERGEGNSLGRMIFRFPNKFSVYLHDTTNKEAFNRSWRGVSHGCIRLEHPFDLAHFILGNSDEKLLERIRVAIDMEPTTDYGRELLEKSGYKHLGYKSFDKPIPVLITYFTAYPNVRGKVEYYDDVYGYDALLLAHLRH